MQWTHDFFPALKNLHNNLSCFN